MMPNVSKVTDEQLVQARTALDAELNRQPKAWEIAERIKTTTGITLDDSTIRGRFIVMGNPLRGGIGEPKPVNQTAPIPTLTAIKEIAKTQYEIPDDMRQFIPQEAAFSNYIERPVDKRLKLHLDLGKFTLTQGKQGTGKTTGYHYYAMRSGLPMFEFCCHPDFKLHKLFGDKTIKNGNVEFVESILVKAVQNPSVILFDEINRIDEREGAAFHALLASRKLFVKDADNGNGKWYELHKDCKVGFAMNPKSAKYIGTQTKNSAFLGRCTFITYPEFTKAEIKGALMKKFPTVHKDDIAKFVSFYFACVDTIEKANIPVDISIRQLNNVVELWLHGMPIKEAIEDGMTSILEAASQPKAKEAFFRLAQAVWKELMEESKNEKTGTATMASFLVKLGRIV